MRYSNLLSTISLIAIGTMALATPSEKVRVPYRATTNASARPKIVQQDRDGVASPEGVYSDYLADTNTAATSNGLHRSDFILKLKVFPGKRTEDAEFEVTYTGPPGYELDHFTAELKVDNLDLLEFRVWLDGGGARDTLRFKATDLRASGIHFSWRKEYHYLDSPVQALPALRAGRVCRVTVYVTDPLTSRTSRGASTLAIESEPVELRL